MTRWRRKRWRVLETHDGQAAEIAQAVGCSPPIAKLLVNRGVDTPASASEFLNPSLDHLADPFLLPDAELAAERLKLALNNHEKIIVHGDYDGDGVTAAALWTRTLEKLGADVTVHVPHRKRDGYDMRSQFVTQAKADGVKLIVTTDCGIRRVQEVEEAREVGIDVIVTDHHEPGEHLPKAIAVVNPHRKDSRYPFPHLAGVGVAFRMGEALVRHLGHPVDSYRKMFIDLAAIGTTTDMMPLLGENRVIVKFGLEQLRCTRKPGLDALMRAAQIRKAALSARDIGFAIGPRLNAVGRLEDSRTALDLLLTRDPQEAQTLAGLLERINAERRQEQERVLVEALAQLGSRDLTGATCLVVSGTTWNPGVIGLVANKIVERYHRPTVMIAMDEGSGLARGSARSIQPFNMFEAISNCGEHLLEFGGHSHAAGMSLQMDRIAGFAEAMNHYAAGILTEEDLIPSLDVDFETGPESMTLQLVRELSLFEPWGCANPEPTIISRGVRIIEAKIIGKDQQHLKLRVDAGEGNPVDALLWNGADLMEHIQPGDRLDLCYRPGLNNFNGRISVQFTVQDLRPMEDMG